MKELTSIKLIKQPKNSLYCGAACINMVQNFYDKDNVGLEEVWNYISDKSPYGRRYCKTYKMGMYLEKRQLLTSIIRFNELDIILKYCKEKRIPGILNIHSFENKKLGHFVLFINYNDGVVIIRDPENEKRVAVKISELEELFIKNTDNNEIGGNIIILTSKNTENNSHQICIKCNSINVLHSDLKDKISGFICKYCDSYNLYE